MSKKPHNYSTMEPILGSSVCLICFEMTEKDIFVPSDDTEKLFNNCNKYLHSTLTKRTLQDIKLHNENQVPLCKSCFDSALELTQLSEQLTTIEKDISDLTVTFSMAVFHRRSQVYSSGQNCQTSSIVQFNEACLPPNLFSMKIGDQNICPNQNNQEMDINFSHLQTDIDISNVKCEASDIQFDNLSGNPQQSVANDDIEIQFKKENSDKQSGQSTIEQNLESTSEIRIVHVMGRNDSKVCADPNNGVKPTMLDLLKSVKMPKIILERIKTVGHKLNVSVGNSKPAKCESRQKNLDKTLSKDDESTIHSCAPESPEDVTTKMCEKTFAQKCHRTLHHKTHSRVKNKQKLVHQSNQKICQITPTGKYPFYKCSYCKKGFCSPSKLRIHERIHTGEKPFKCSFCNSRFNQKENLKRHEIIHTREKPFKCSICSTPFNNANNLKRHKRTHSEGKPFKYSCCNSRFNQRVSLKRHETIHTVENREKPFKSSVCSTRFNRKNSLKRHERTHSREKTFKCLFCEQTFSEKWILQVHERLHTNEKP